MDADFHLELENVFFSKGWKSIWKEDPNGRLRSTLNGLADSQ